MTTIRIVPDPAKDVGRLFRFPADKFKIDMQTNTLTLFQGDTVTAVWKWSDVLFFLVEQGEDND